MLTVDHHHGSYPIDFTTARQPQQWCNLLRQFAPGSGRWVVITDRHVYQWVYPHLFPDAKKLDLIPIIVEAGEAQKNLTTVTYVIGKMIAAGCDRQSLVIALGGGVVGDLAGFCAATFMRGIPWVQIPTTLLAQVDASIGGKTGVNHPQGKNMIGAFYPPCGVFIDTAWLQTLPAREFYAGLAEVIKHGLLADAALFADLESQAATLRTAEASHLLAMIKRACAVKIRIVSQDPNEQGARVLLNLGHTFAHAIETHFAYQRWVHGEAVAIGLHLAAYFSQRLGHINDAARSRVASLLMRAHLPTHVDGMTAADFLHHMRHDKKNQGGAMRLVLLRQLGTAYVETQLDTSLIANWVGDFLQQNA